LFGGLTLAAVLAAGCETADESTLDRSSVNDNPACVGDDGFAMGEAPPILTMADIAFTLGTLGQLQAAVTPLVAAGLPPEPLFKNPDGTSSTWTTWYKYPDMRTQLARLGVMRGILDKANLWDQYAGNINPALDGTPFGPGGQMPAAGPCGEYEAQNRTIDGTCNDFAKPSMGARGVRFGRNIQPFLPGTNALGLPNKNPAAQFDALNFMNPSPREVSRQLFTASSPSARQKVPFLNMFAAAWIQFQVHDWFDHGDN
jgi:hypothetical protein